MAGYDGYRMSNNAVSAYESGYKPISKWSKYSILEALEDGGYDYEFFEKWSLNELKTLLEYKEWHHTSGSYRETDFYGLNIKLVEEYLQGKREKPVIEKTKKKKLELEEGFWHGKYRETEYHPTSTSKWNKYKIWFTPFENARKKGNWIVLENGKKKKFENCIELVHTKYKRRKKNINKKEG